MPNHCVDDLLRTIGISGLSRVRTELLHLAVVAALTPHPVRMHRQLPRNRYLGDLPTTSHGEVEKFAGHSGWLRTVTCAASTNRKRSSALPCLLM
jgi:hypothetical protein